MMYRNYIATTCALLVAAGGLRAQQYNAAFEAASVKANRSGEQGMRIRTPGAGQLTASNTTLSLLMAYAHEVQGFRLVGSSPVLNDRFDIVAKLPAGDNQQESARLREALRLLLATRFKAVVHRETRETGIFALIMARPDHAPGRLLTPSKTDCSPTGAAARGAGAAAGRSPGMCGIQWTGTTARFGGVTMTQLAAALSPVDRRMVIDRTGLQGTWDGELTYTDSLQGGPPPDVAAPDLFTAVQEQLGLKLEAATGPVEVVVVDRVQQPLPD
jgi:uncharacterized protein (TIGR03435 family)